MPPSSDEDNEDGCRLHSAIRRDRGNKLAKLTSIVTATTTTTNCASLLGLRVAILQFAKTDERSLDGLLILS